MKKYVILTASVLFSSYVFSANYSTQIDLLTKQFQDSFREALAQEKSRLIHCPLITQDLLSMTLHAKNNTQYRFIMKKNVFKILAEISHIPLVLHNIADAHDWQFNDHMAIQLSEYLQLLQETSFFFDQSELDIILKNRISEIITLSDVYITDILTNKNMHKNGYSDYALLIRPLIEKNLAEGAKIQIEQFHNQMQLWQKQYPDEQWQCLNVAILGTHDPREGYTLKQYFQWLLKEPAYEKNVIYVEFNDIKDIFSSKEKSTTLAIDALINNSYQQKIGINFMQDASYMQRDVMSTAAKKILDNMQEDRE